MYYNDYNRRDDIRDDTSPLPPAVVEETPKKKKRGAVRVTALCLACALVGGIAGGAATARLAGNTASATRSTIYEGEAPAAVTVANVTTAEQPLTMAQVYAANVNSTVGITTELVTTNMWGQRVKSAAAGSGFVVSSDGYIVTNYHVIEGATSIEVAFADGTTYPATLVGGEYSSSDVAVLKIDATGLTPVVLGDSDALAIGEEVAAIGNPLGELTFSMTVGHVSGKDRPFTYTDGKTVNMIQTDTVINGGNSGGALFNSYGQVVGIATGKYSGSTSSSGMIEGISFAIPINSVKSVITDLISTGYVSGKPSLGIMSNNVSSQAQYYGIPAGAYVEAVLEGSAAEKAGLKVGDIITAVDGTEISGSKALNAALTDKRAGDSVTLTVYREGGSVTLTATLDELTAEREQAMNDLQESYQESQQQAQQQQQQNQNSGNGWGSGNGSNGYNYSWPFSFFGW